MRRTFGLVLLLTGCTSDRVLVTTNLTPSVRFIGDSADVRLLISAQEKNDAAEVRWLRGSQPREERVQGVKDRQQHPELYAPTLRPFLDAMAARPGFSVPADTTCRLLIASEARCAPGRLDTYMYVKVQIKGGPMRGQEGWTCAGIDVFSTTPGFP